MTERLDIRQRNNLLAGNSLTAEIAGTSANRRAFLSVQPYRLDLDPPSNELSRALYGNKRKAFSRFLNADHSDIRFVVRSFEVDTDDLDVYLRESWVSYDAELEVYELTSRLDIAGIEGLETELRKYLDNLSALDVSWRVIPW